MQFTVEFYVTRQGNCPLRDFLDRLRITDPDDHAAVLAGMYRLRDQRYHRAPLSRALSGGLFELRHVGKLNTRVLYFFMSNHRIVAVHGIRNKAQKVRSTDMRTARQRMADWLERSIQ